MADQPSPVAPRTTLYDRTDDAGRAWLDEFIRLVNDGAYDEASEAVRADETAIHGTDA